jgi:hypothetical protein
LTIRNLSNQCTGQFASEKKEGKMASEAFDEDDGYDDNHPGPAPGWTRNEDSLRTEFKSEMRTYVTLMHQWRRNRALGFLDPKPIEPMSVEERKVYCMLSKDERPKFRAQRAEQAARGGTMEESDSEETSESEEQDETIEDAGGDMNAQQQKTVTFKGETGKRQSEVEQKKRNIEDVGVGVAEVSCKKKGN